MPTSKPQAGDSTAWVSWQEYTDSRLTALERQAEAAQEALELRLAAECKALDARFAGIDNKFDASAQAITAAKTALDARLELLQHFQQTMQRVMDTSVTKGEFELLRDRVGSTASCTELDSVSEKIAKIETWQARQEGKASQTSVLWSYLVAGISLALALASFILARVAP